MLMLSSRGRTGRARRDLTSESLSRASPSRQLRALAVGLLCNERRPRVPRPPKAPFLNTSIAPLLVATG